MTKEDIQKYEEFLHKHVDDLIIKAIQSGKKETSDLAYDLKESIKTQVKEGIKEHVNGKLDTLSKKMDDYIEKDGEWKSRAEPVIKMGENMQATSKVMAWGIGGMTAIGGVILMIKQLFKQ